MNNFPFKAGDRIGLASNGNPPKWYVTVTAVGTKKFLGVSSGGHEEVWLISDNWAKYIEPPTPTSFHNLYKDGWCSISCPTRSQADFLADRIREREAVLVRYSDGTWKVEQ